MSGSTIGGVVGGVIGYAVTGTYQGFQVGFMAGSLAGGYVDPDVIKGPKLTDAQGITVQEGAPRYIIYGTGVCGGNVLQAGPLVPGKHRERTGKSGPVQGTYTYSRTFALGVCEGPVGGIARIWMDGKLVYDVRNPADWPDDAADILAMRADSAKFASKITIYLGGETQLPDASLELLPPENGGGSGNVSAYRGTCYIVFHDFDLTSHQGAIPQFRFEVSDCDAGTIVAGANSRWYLTADNGSTGTGNDNVVWTADSLAGPWAGPFTRSATNSTETDMGVYDTGTSFLYIKTNDTHYEVSTDYNSDGNFTSTIGTFPFNINRVVCFGAGQAIALNFDASFDTDKYLVTTDGGQTWDQRDFEPGIGAGRGMMDVARLQTASGQRLICSGINNADLRKLYYCDANDLGASLFWTEAVMGSGVVAGNRIACTGAVAATLGASGPNGFISRTSTGDSWELVDTATNWTAAGEAYGRNSSLIFGASGFGNSLIVSVDSGDTWSETLVDYTPRRFSSSDTEIVMSIDSTLVAETPKKSTDGGITFTDITTPSGGGASNETIVRVGAYPIYTYTLPDAPDYTTDIDGSVIGGPDMDIAPTCSAVLSDILADIFSRVGLSPDQYDVSTATDDVRGFVIGRQMSASDAIRSLQQAYFGDTPEWGDYTDAGTKIRWVKRGGPAVWAITDDDLVESDDDEDTRAQAIEFPRKINLLTADVEADYNPTKQTAERVTENVKAVGEATIELPISTTRDEAAQIVDKMHKIAWAEAEGRCKRILPPEFEQYTPSDCGTYNGKRWRIEQSTTGDGTNEWELVRDRASAYTSVATSGDLVAPGGPVPTVRGPTLFSAMNLPSLRSADNTPGMYVSARGILPGWAGCRLQLSVDGGLTYGGVLDMITPALMGPLTAGLAVGGPTLSVNVGRDELDSVTDAQLAVRANAFAITSLGVSEIGQFKTATETSSGPNKYDLTDLTRAELGTTEALHSAGDMFVLLDSAVYFLPLDVSLAGKTLLFRPVTFGTAEANNRVYSVVFAPQFIAAPEINFRVTESGDIRVTEAGDYRLVE